ncbi:MAG TPA: BatD family protein, partial [Puia sp.]|nr:BatD family protein [Puia sp.]
GNAAPNNNNAFLPPSISDPFGPAEPADIDREYVLRPGENIKDKIRKNLFVRVQVDKNTCYVGEPIVATYKLYSRLNSESRVTKRPSLNGFSVYDMIDPNADAVSVEKLNGKPYTVHIIRKTQLVPLQAGTIDLDPVEVENTVHFVRKDPRQEHKHSGNAMRDFFDQMAGEDEMGPEVTDNVTLDTKPLPITIKPLPEENRPAGFNGAVGRFSIQASLANRNISAQEDATLHVVVRGQGNLPVITAPSVSWPNGIEAFDPTAKEDVNKTVAPMSGSKSFDYVFTPRNPGHYTIPPITFPYFDPSSRSYKTAETASLDIQVAPALHKPGSSSTASRNHIGPSENGLVNRLSGFVQEHLEWIFTVLILSLIAVYLWRQNIRLKKSNPVQNEADTDKPASAPSAGSISRTSDFSGGNQASRNSGLSANTRNTDISNAPSLPVPESASIPDRPDRPERVVPDITSAPYLPTSMAADPLQETRQLFENGDYKGFYREVNRAIWKALSKKLELPASQLNKLNIVHQLQRRGWDTQHLLLLENMLSECEMNLYTPAYDTYNMQQLLRQAESMLDRLA